MTSFLSLGKGVAINLISTNQGKQEQLDEN